MEDYLVRIIAKDAGVRAIACITTDLVNEMATRNETSETATAVIGEAITGGALLGSLLKIKHRVAAKFDGDGPVGKVVVESDAYGKVRGYLENSAVNTLRDEAPIDPYGVQEALGEGVLHVSRDMRLPELVQSYTPLKQGVTDTLDYYLNQSEQVKSLIQVGTVLGEDGLVVAAGGILLQNLGDSKANTLALLQERLAEMPPIEEQLHNGTMPENILENLFAGIEYIYLEERPIRFVCTCSRERVEKAIIVSGEEEIRFLIADGGATVDCHFCHEQYEFDVDDLEEILEELLGEDDEDED